MSTEPIRHPMAPPAPEARGGRSCSTCACYFEQAQPAEPTKLQGFCQRNQAAPMLERFERPVMKDGKPVIRHNKATGRDEPVTETGQQLAYMYAPMQAALVCFDGWRPKGTLPGERSLEKNMRELEPTLRAALKINQVPDSLQAVIFAMLGVQPEPPRSAADPVN